MSRTHHSLGYIMALFATLRSTSLLIPDTLIAMNNLMHPEKIRKIAGITYLSLIPKLLHERWLAAKLQSVLLDTEK